MTNELRRLHLEYQDLVAAQRLDESELDYSRLEMHKTLLAEMDKISSACISIFDLHLGSHTYLSSKFFDLLEYDPKALANNEIAYINSRVHPDDLLTLTRNGLETMRFYIGQPIDTKRDFKLVSEYRITKGDNSYVRVIEQMQALELDSRGNVWLSLSFMEIAPNQDLTAPATSSVVNFKTGEVFPVGRSGVLTSREKEILGLVRDGLASKHIAGELSISVHTVNTHRQKILEKLNVGNSVEAVRYAQQLGLLS
jgi:DNA-binding CsgD family transcriptional regulator